MNSIVTGPANKSVIALFTVQNIVPGISRKHIIIGITIQYIIIYSARLNFLFNLGEIPAGSISKFN